MDLYGFVKSRLIQIVFIVAGALGGFLYWRFIGCEDGTCAIKSVWYWSTLWGAALGYLAGDLISEFKNRRFGKRREE